MATADLHIIVETDNHLTAAKHAEAAGAPAQLTWADLGTDLGQRFATAIEKLERLMYVIAGAPPASYAPFKPPTHRVHPRCLWIVEQSEQKVCVNYAPPNCSGDNQHTEYYEYAALGGSVHVPVPSVPVRSRSGDPMRQMLDTDGERSIFPVGSVTRTDGTEAHDPRGHGFFGGDPAHIGSDGPIEIAGETVTVRWVPPAAILARVQSATLYANVLAVPAAMNLVDGGYQAVIPAQSHDTTVQWYITCAVSDGQTPPTITNYREPLSGSYTYVAFSHYNPYAHGLPEMMDAWRKGTDRYLFDRSEGIQPELINMCRYILDVLGRRFVHSPQRSGVGANSMACCLELPIIWRWSGAGRWPLYVAGGKGGTNGVHPLHNLDEEIAEPAGRDSWRGVEWPYGEILNAAGSWAFPSAAHDASWLTPLKKVGNDVTDTFDLSALRRWMTSPPGDPDVCRTWWDSRGRGLHVGDVIQKVHVEEIIQAVEYLISNGLWLKVPIRRRPKTPQGTFLDGLGCGQYHNRSALGVDSYGNYPAVLNTTCSWFINGGVTPVDWPTPSDWNDCWAATEKYCAIDQQTHAWPHQACPIEEVYTYGPVFDWPDPAAGTRHWLVRCGGPSMLMSDSDCGYSEGVKARQDYHALYESFCDTRARGWEAWICGPVRCPGGCDADHGNPAGWKFRSDHVCPGTDDLIVPTYRYGNCLDYTFSCGGVVDAGDQNLGFQTVRAVRWHGACGGWLGWCDNVTGYFGEPPSAAGDCIDDEDIPAVAGLPSKYDWHGNHFCTQRCRMDTDPIYADWLCALGNTDCDPDLQWARIDLNLGGAGYASAAGMPVLKAYHATPTPDPTTFPSGGAPIAACPCETADPTSGRCDA